MIQIAEQTTPRPAEKERGYPIGIDGLMSIDEAKTFLGGISDDTLDRLFRDGLIRKTQISGRRIGICRRSVMNYLADREMVPAPR